MDDLKRQILSILNLGGTVSFSYKNEMKDWVGNITIGSWDGKYIINNGSISGVYDSDNSIDILIKHIFNPDNLYLCYQRIKNRTGIEFDFEYPSKRNYMIFYIIPLTINIRLIFSSSFKNC